jgi:hypothetical protein
VAGRISSTEKSNDNIVNRTGYLPACSIVPQPSTLPRKKYLIVPTEWAGLSVTLLTRTREMLGSYLGQAISYSDLDFAWFLLLFQANAAIMARSGHHRSYYMLSNSPAISPSDAKYRVIRKSLRKHRQ